MSLLVAAVVAVAVFAVARALARRGGASRLARRVDAHVLVEPARAPREQRQGPRLALLLDDAEERLGSHAWWRVVEVRVERAGLERRPVELAAAVAACTVLLALLAAAAGSPVALLLALTVPAAASWAALALLAQRRLRAFDEELPSVLATLASSLRAGHGFLQGLQAVASDTPDPAGRELRRALSEIRLGRPPEEALAEIGRRVPSRDLDYVLTAITVQRQIGGSLAGLFETVTETVRARQQFARKVRALTASGRTSAWVLVALPFGLAGLLSLANHHYLSPLFDTSLGRLLVGGGLVSMCIGTLLVRRVVSFRA